MDLLRRYPNRRCSMRKYRAKELKTKRLTDMNHHAHLEKHGLAKPSSGWVKRPDINRSNDADLAIAASKAIECLTTVPLETINVTARNGWLHLEGTVTCGHQRTTLKD